MVFQVFATPPLQVADEENHFLRALSIADGHLFARTFAAEAAGAFLDPGALRLAHAFDGLKFAPGRKLDLALYAEMARLPWGDGPKVAADFPNTAIYPAFFYGPAALGLKLGRSLRWTILDSFHLARLLTAATALLGAALSILVCARGRTVLFVILCFPMVLGLFGSVSQDALALASGALVVALWSRIPCAERDIPLAGRAGAAFLLGAVVAARIPLLPLLGLVLVPTSDRRAPFVRAHAKRDAVLRVLAGLAPVAFGLVGAALAKVPFRAGEGVSPPAQAVWVLRHPLAAWDVAAATLSASGGDDLRQMVGVLGWLDTDLPAGFHTWVACCLGGAVLLDLLSPEPSLGRSGRRLIRLLVLLAVGSVFGALYLAWTPVGAPMVEGVQGRYLLVPALFCALALPPLAWIRRTRGLERAVRAAALALCAAVAAGDLLCVPFVILRRYYG